MVDDRLDDAAAALRQHHAQLVLQAQHGAQHVGVEGGGVRLGRLLDQRPRLPLGARVVDGDIEPAEARHGAVDQRPHVRLVPDVRPHELRLGAQLRQFVLQRRPGVRVAAGDHQAGTLARKGERRGATDAGEGAGDEDDGSGHGGSLGDSGESME